MTEIIFQPWVGSKYKDASPVRLLLVGESQYGEPGLDISESTKVVIAKWKVRDWSIRYLVAAARLLTGLQAWQIDRDTNLESIAWYNFVQVLMPWNNVRPTADQFRASSPAFLEAVTTLDPTHILATGRELWRYLPPEGSLERIQFRGEPFEMRRYSTPSGEAKAVAIPHLSRGFSPPRWQGPIADFLAT